RKPATPLTVRTGWQLLSGVGVELARPVMGRFSDSNNRGRSKLRPYKENQTRRKRGTGVDDSRSEQTQLLRGGRWLVGIVRSGRVRHLVDQRQHALEVGFHRRAQIRVARHS